MEVKLPLTNKVFYQGKFFSVTAKTVEGRAYTPSGQLIDAELARKAERAARWKLHGAWREGDRALLQQKAPSELSGAYLWIRVPGLKTGMSQAKLKQAVAQAKTGIKAQIAAQGVKVLWDDPISPILVVEGEAQQIDAVGMHSAVGYAQLRGRTA